MPLDPRRAAAPRSAAASRPPRRAAAGRRLAWIVLLALACARGAPAARALAVPGHLEYRIAWNGIPAANATVDVSAEEFAGDPAYVVQISAATNRVVDIFWRFRGHARASFLGRGSVPLGFTYERVINGVTEITWIDFDLDARRAQSVYIKKGRRKELDVDAAGLSDPITAVFRARASDARVGDRLTYRVFTGESHYRVTLSLLGEEVIDVPAGRFEALKVEPEVWKLGRTLERDRRLRRATVWVTRDPSRTLLRVRSEAYIGAVTLDLVSLAPPPEAAG